MIIVYLTIANNKSWGEVFVLQKQTVRSFYSCHQRHLCFHLRYLTLNFRKPFKLTVDVRLLLFVFQRTVNTQRYLGKNHALKKNVNMIICERISSSAITAVNTPRIFSDLRSWRPKLTIKGNFNKLRVFALYCRRNVFLDSNAKLQNNILFNSLN